MMSDFRGGGLVWNDLKKSDIREGVKNGPYLYYILNEQPYAGKCFVIGILHQLIN